MFLFSGQGSQYFQMGRQLYEHNADFRAAIDPLDRQAHARLGCSVLGTLYGGRGKAERFDDIRFSHPAVYMVEYALARTVMARGLQPDGTLGASLGTVCALVIAGGLSAEAGLDLVIRQALTFADHGTRGGMVAVLAPTRLHAESAVLRDRAVIAGRNLDTHFLLSALQPDLPAIEAELLRLGVAFQTLPVDYPFHSPWIDPLREHLRGESPRLDPSTLPVLCCAQGGQLRDPGPDYFWQVARRPIDFIGAIAEAERSGPHEYLDLGPTGTLATFLKYLLPKSSRSRAVAAMTPYGCELGSVAAIAPADRAAWHRP